MSRNPNHSPLDAQHEHEPPAVHRWLAEAAYYKALARGFKPHHEMEDWLHARQEFEALLAKRRKHGLVVRRCS